MGQKSLNKNREHAEKEKLCHKICFKLPEPTIDQKKVQESWYVISYGSIPYTTHIPQRAFQMDLGTSSSS